MRPETPVRCAPSPVRYPASFSVLVQAFAASGAVSGSVYFDDMNVGAPVLFVQSDHDLGEISVTYTEAYLA